MNLAKLLEGPAVVYHRGIAFDSRGGAALNPTADAFQIDTDRMGPIGQRRRDSSVQLSLTPIGEVSDAIFGVTHRWRNAPVGQLLTPRYDVASADATADTVTLLASGDLYPRLGCPALLYTDGALPTGATEDTIYFLGIPDAESPLVRTLHTTEANAIAGTSKVALTDTGSGDSYLIEQEPLIIHTTMNRKITFWNAAVVQMPVLNFSTVQTLFGSITFEAFRKNNKDRTVDNSLYTVEKAVLSQAIADDDDIKTIETTLGFGTAPWDSFQSRTPASLSVALQTSVVETDQRGTLGRKIQSIAATAQCQPSGFTEAQLLDILGMQGTGTGRGTSMIRDDLTISGANLYAVLYNAAARAQPQTFDPQSPRAGTMDFIAARSANTAAYYLGTVAPS